MAGRVVSDFQMEIRPEFELGAGFQFLEDEAGRQLDGVTDGAVVHAQQGRILVPHREGAGGGSRDDFQPLRDGFLDSRNVVLGMFGGLLGHSVDNHRDAAAFLFLQQLDPDAEGVHHLDKVLSELRVVVIDIAAVEIGDLFGEGGLATATAFEPAFETRRAVLREGPVPVDGEGSVQDGLRHAERGHAIDDGGERPGELAHEVGRGQDPVAQFRCAVVIADPCGLDDVGDMDPGRTGYLAALAVEAVLQGLVEEIRVFQAQPFAVRTGLLRAGIEGIDLDDRAVGGTHGAFHALFKVVRAGCIFLQSHGLQSFTMFSATAMALRRAKPPPMPISSRVAPRMEPAT